MLGADGRTEREDLERRGKVRAGERIQKLARAAHDRLERDGYEANHSWIERQVTLTGGQKGEKLEISLRDRDFYDDNAQANDALVEAIETWKVSDQS